ncbi:MAG: cation diffusion facilitator family transporter [Syntrophorhabdaceae bacterium]|nr:cation diffusion facilitator family transporter [Syntrophorhabdaceae bacterium]
MNKNQYMMLAVKVSLLSNVVLCIIKVVALVIVDSLAIAADLGISCVALAVSIILYYAIKISNKPADFLHNYGYGRIENVCEVVEGVVLVGLALAMSFQAIMHIIRVEEVKAPWIGFICTLAGVIINFWGSYYILKLAQKSASPALKAEGLHFKLEGYISTAITLSFLLIIIATREGFDRVVNYIDPGATLFVSGVIAVPSIRLLREAFMKLLDASMEEGGQMDVVKVLGQHINKYCNFKDLKTRTAGRKRFIDMHIVMPEHIQLSKGHQVISDIKSDIDLLIAESEVTIRMVPCKKDCSFVRENKQCPYSE